MKQNDFDKIAFVYDLLARLIFGKSIIDSQKYFLNKIPEGANILILGGGTGEILSDLFKSENGIHVCYIESSAKMISQAKQKIDSNQIQFILGTEDNIPIDQQFDIVIASFYLDLFSEGSLKIVLEKIKRSTATQALWLVTDFIDDKLWQRVMLKVMYLFFRIACNIEASRLPNWRQAIISLKAKEIESKFFYGNFIQTKAFQF